MKKIFMPLGIIVLMMVFTLGVQAQLDPFGNLRLGNEYIEIIVNANPENTGRFAVDITGGNPISKSDDGEPLIYGRPRPWTSFTTVQIDGENYVFGGKTPERAGKAGKYGQVTMMPTISSENGQKSIITTTRFNQVEVEQILSFSKSSTTGLYDTVLIKYRVTNQDKVARKVGLRVMLDTMLGANDGAPYRVGDKAILTDTYFQQANLPTFWQAFDALSDTKVTAQGTLVGPDVTAPDKMYFSDWGSMADGLWDFKYQAGEDFLREGEYELDSATALFWTPMALNPGETRTYVTKYGLGGITVVPGILSLGVTSPAEVVFDTQTTSFPVVAYIENTSEIVAKQVVAQIQLPQGFEIVENSAQKSLGNMEPGSTGQVAWEVRPIKGAQLPEKITYTVKADAANTDHNEVQRQVRFTPPPRLSITIQYPDKLSVKNETIAPNPFDLVLKLKNVGGSPAHEVRAYVVLPPGLELADKERGSKPIGMLNVGEEYVIPWKIKASNMLSGKLPFGIEVHSLNSPTTQEVREVAIPELSSKVYMTLLKDKVKEGEFFGVRLLAANISDLGKVALNIQYDPAKVQAMYVSKGTLFVRGGESLPWGEPAIDRNLGLISGLTGDLAGAEETSGVIAEIYFKALESGPTVIHFTDVVIYTGSGRQIPLKVENLTIQVK